MAIRSINELHPTVQAKAQQFLRLCEQDGLDVRIIETYRPSDRQAALYAIGRTVDLGKKPVTNAKPGETLHEYRLAFDAVPFVDGQPDWDRLDLFDRMGAIGKTCGLAWGGDWKMKDRPHFQWTGGLTLAQLQAGQRPPAPEVQAV